MLLKWLKSDSFGPFSWGLSENRENVWLGTRIGKAIILFTVGDGFLWDLANLWIWQSKWLRVGDVLRAVSWTIGVGIFLRYFFHIWTHVFILLNSCVSYWPNFLLNNKSVYEEFSVIQFVAIFYVCVILKEGEMVTHNIHAVFIICKSVVYYLKTSSVSSAAKIYPQKSIKRC